MDQETRQKLLRKAGIGDTGEDYDRQRKESQDALRRRQAEMTRRLKGR